MLPLSNLLWIDCSAAAIGGVAVLLLTQFGILGALYSVPVGLLKTTAAVNLAYGCFSFSLAIQSRPNRNAALLLVGANSFWALVCLVIALSVATQASVFGVAHYLLESLFVGVLARSEWLALRAYSL